MQRCVFLLLLACCWLHTQALAGNTFKYRAADGSVVFSDVGRGSSGARQYKYLGSTSRGTAKVSCNGHIEQRLLDPKTNIQASINHFAGKYNVNHHLIKAIARIESCFDIRAVSKVGAKGLMQLMPATAKELGVVDLFDVNANIEAGVRYFDLLMKQFNYNHKLALAAYNAGPGAVALYQGVPPYPETRAYVKRVLQKYREYSLPGGEKKANKF